MDDGADVIGVLHSARREQLGDVIAGTEETTTGVIRLKALEADGKLAFPVIAVNEAQTKHLFDNRYGTGPVDRRRHHPRDERPARGAQVRRRRLRLVRPRRRVAEHAAWGRTSSSPRSSRCGRSRRSWTGYEVLPMDRAAEVGDIFVTATGTSTSFADGTSSGMKDGVILANAGHFNVEIEIPALRRLATATRGSRGRWSRSSSSRTAAACTCSPRAGSSTSLPPRGILLR